MFLNLEFDSSFWGIFMQFILFCFNLSFIIYLAFRERGKGREAIRETLEDKKVNKIKSRYN